METNTRTPDQIKATFKRNGQTITSWAIANGYTPNKVFRVLNGFEKGQYGKAHDIAVKLGLKSPIVSQTECTSPP